MAPDEVFPRPVQHPHERSVSYFMENKPKNREWVKNAAIIFLAVLLVPTGICCWVFPLLSRFTLDFNSLCRNSVRLALGHVPATLALGLGAMVCLWLTLRFAFLPLFLLPALFALYISLFLEPVFRQYEHPEE